MINSRLIDIELSLELNPISQNEELFKKEFDMLVLSSSETSSYISLLSSRASFKNSDPVLVELLVGLHKRLDSIERLINKDQIKLLDLQIKTNTLKIGHGILIPKDTLAFKQGVLYYGRIFMPIFPKRHMPFIGEYDLSTKSIKITNMDYKDINDFDNFIATKEREIIRLKKNYNTSR